MPFDLNTAKPLESSDAGGFDLGSAKPEGGGPAVSVPAEKVERKKAGLYRPSTDSDTFEGAGRVALGSPEAVASAVSGILAAPVAGISGLVRTGYEMVKGQPASEAFAKGGGTARHVAEALTYTPKSEGGKAGVEAVSLPMTVASELLGWGGEKAGQMVGNEAAGRTVGETIPAVAPILMGVRGLRKPVEEKPPTPGKDFSPLREMSKEEADRFFAQKSQGVEPTLGSTTRDPAQIRFEQQTANTPVGSRLFQRLKEQDAALADSVERLTQAPEVKGASAKTEKDTGAKLRSTLEKEADREFQAVDKAYEKARAAGETKAEVDVKPLIKYLKDNEPAAIAVKELQSVSASLRKLLGVDESTPAATAVGSGKISGRMEKKVEKPESSMKVTIDDLEFLRQQVGKLAQKDGSVKSYMGDIRKIIDSVTEGKGGDLYKEARAKRKAWGDKYEEQLAVANVLEKPTRTDYKVAVEDVWKKVVVGGSDQDLSNVLRVLKSTEGEGKAAAVDSMKNLQKSTIDHLHSEATKTGTFSPAAFKKAMDSIGEDKLRMLLGDKALNSLKQTLKNADDVKKQPLKVPGSDTMVNMQTMAQKLASEHADSVIKTVLPSALGRAYGAVKESFAKKAEAQKMEAAIDESLTPRRASVADIKKQADEAKKARRQYLMKEGASRGAPFAASATYQLDEK
jgi:hypothetical protein